MPLPTRSRRSSGPLALLVPLGLATWLGAAWAGCSADNGGDQSFTGGEDQSASSATSGSGGATSSSSGTGGDETLIDAGPNDDGGLDEDAACAASEAEASQIPLDMLILLDRSGSMYGTNWDGATGALINFVSDPASDGINVGITYYPIDNPPDADACNHDHYDVPVVPVGTLPGNAQALIDSINLEDPNGGSTPTYGALWGVLEYATAYQDANLDHKVIVVFASDGDPNSCAYSPVDQNDPDVIGDLAQSAYNYNGVPTYVIAIQGANLANLNIIAAKGGTQNAYDVTGNINGFAQKMAEIRMAALGCKFGLPTPPNNEEIDPEKVNVTYTPGGSGQTQTLPQADSLLDCGGGPGWYYSYDPDGTPNEIQLCPATCTIVQADADAVVKVLFGCKTEVN